MNKCRIMASAANWMTTHLPPETCLKTRCLIEPGFGFLGYSFRFGKLCFPWFSYSSRIISSCCLFRISITNSFKFRFMLRCVDTKQSHFPAPGKLVSIVCHKLSILCHSVRRKTLSSVSSYCHLSHNFDKLVFGASLLSELSDFYFMILSDGLASLSIHVAL